AKLLIWGPNTNTKANIHSMTDVDYFQLPIRVASTIEITLRDIPEAMALNLELVDEQSRVVAKSENQSNQIEQISINADPGTYYVKIYAARHSEIKPHQY